MPSGVYVRTEEHKRHISESMKGEKIQCMVKLERNNQGMESLGEEHNGKIENQGMENNTRRTNRK